MLKMFRWQGLLGFVAFVGLLVLFWLFYASTLIKNSIESFGSDIAGAKVELAQVNLSFDPLGLELRNLKVADAEQPMKNLVQLEQINAQMELTPLLLGKVIIQDISMTGLLFNTDRKTSGALKKAAKQAPQPSKSVEKDKSSDAEDSIIPDLDIKAKIPSTSEILSRETLLTEERGNTFKESLENSKTALSETKEKIPSKQTIQEYEAELNAIIKGKITSVADYKARKKKLDALKQRMKDDKLALQKARDQVSSMKSDLQSQLKDLKAAPGDDLKRLKDKYQLNAGGAENISQLLFGDQINQYLPMVQGYYKKAKPIIEKMKENQEEEKARERLEGRFVSFPLAKPKPDFLVERMTFSVSLTNGDLVTKWADITHQQDVMGRPTTLSIMGEGFSQTAKLDIKGLFDHRGDKSINNITLDMKGLQVKELKLAGEKMLLKKASTHVTGQVDFGLDAVDLKAKAKFLQTDFENLGTSNFDQEMGLILAKVEAFDIDASAQGNPLRPSISMTSNLDKMFADATKARFQEKKAEFEQQLKEKLTEKMLSYTGEYKDQLKQLDLANGSMAENRDKIESMMKSEVNDFIAEQKKKAKAKAEAAAKKELEKLKGRFGF